MAAQDFFSACNEMTVDGIKNLKIMVNLTGGTAITFPIDYVVSGGTTTIVGTDDPDNQYLTIGNQNMSYIEPTVLNSSFEEVSIKDRRGKYFEQTLIFQFPKIQLYTNNQIKDFLFAADGDFAIANACVVIRDNNDKDWIMGYDLPMVVEDFDLTTGGDDNNYEMRLVGRSYERIRPFSYL